MNTAAQTLRERLAGRTRKKIPDAASQRAIQKGLQSGAEHAVEGAAVEKGAGSVLSTAASKAAQYGASATRVVADYGPLAGLVGETAFKGARLVKDVYKDGDVGKVMHKARQVINRARGKQVPKEEDADPGMVRIDALPKRQAATQHGRRVARTQIPDTD